MMFQVGVTGGIGSGKTLVCNVLEKLGIPIYKADLEARRLMEEDLALMGQIVELFGEEAYIDGVLNRSYLAGRVFGDRKQLERLNGLVHPAVRKDYHRWLNEQKGVPYVVEEAAILFESGASRWMDLVVMVYAPEAMRISRVMDRDGVEEETVRKRMAQQMGEEEKRAKADLVIVNDEHVRLLPQILDVHRQILERI
ncbi:MAG: dephospho-CoA kinase [Bacteroidales bacterium]